MYGSEKVNIGLLRFNADPQSAFRIFVNIIIGILRGNIRKHLSTMLTAIMML